ncbi:MULTISPECIES: TIGR02530 family flagellar biosynthesis protein [unclassified Virgibacillus]|uniref:TIGR02530 family flagellar biosynthesis protein n=1 Tax=unclassified Virgibacillus TaxID=2620237 RepID=UPI0024DEB324|nr:TIGR02530 family flagellar biosynthesis protein [Virgibacillus sp. LDC-1]
MDPRIQHLQQHHILPLPKGPTKAKQPTASFKEILLQQEELKLSKHATQRLQERNITINAKEWQTISQKVTEARDKGVTDSLVVTSNAALLVNLKNNVVVTAMNREEATSRIFTNINGTIVINQ